MPARRLRPRHELVRMGPVPVPPRLQHGRVAWPKVGPGVSGFAEGDRLATSATHQDYSPCHAGGGLQHRPSLRRRPAPRRPGRRGRHLDAARLHGPARREAGGAGARRIGGRRRPGHAGRARSCSTARPDGRAAIDGHRHSPRPASRPGPAPTARRTSMALHGVGRARARGRAHHPRARMLDVVFDIDRPPGRAAALLHAAAAEARAARSCSATRPLPPAQRHGSARPGRTPCPSSPSTRSCAPRWPASSAPGRPRR